MKAADILFQADNVSATCINQFRADFPILNLKVGDKPLVYLDNAASSQMPQSVIDRLVRYQTTQHANIHRAVHHLSEIATHEYEFARQKLQHFINAREEREVIFTSGTTDAINLVMHGYGRKFIQKGNEIILTRLEHHSNIVPWQMLAEEKGAVIRVVPINDSGELLVEEYEELFNENTRFVALTHVSNALGTINPIKEMIAFAHQRGVPVLIDGAQAAAHLAIDVQALDCDFYTFSAHKLCGPTGIGILYGKAGHLEAMQPFKGGGDMISSVTFEKTTYNTLPYKFEAGTPPIAAAIGFGAAIDYLSNIGLDKIAHYEHELLTYATERLSVIPGVKIVGNSVSKVAVISFTMDGIHPHDVGTLLNQEGIAVRTGHHCAQPIMQRFNIPATSRASFAFYNTQDEVDALIKGIQIVKKVFFVMNSKTIYQEVILDHNRKPRNYGSLDQPSHHAVGHNPLCGDRIDLGLDMINNQINQIAFQGESCAICKASASMMTTAVKGKSPAEAEILIQEFRSMVMGTLNLSEQHHLGRLAVFEGVRDLPTRVKCAILPWHTLHAALHSVSNISTEANEEVAQASTVSI